MNKPRFSRCGKFFVYILECQDGTYYTGYTNDIEKRIKEHNRSKRSAKYTRYRRPVKLVWCRGYKYFRSAVLEEHRIKNLRREQKEKLVKENAKV